MSELVRRVGPIPFFGNLERQIRSFRDELLTDSAQIMRAEEETSIRALWYRTGATLNSLVDEFGEEGEVKWYRLMPTATNRGAPYPLFGEYGTGRRGAASGGPAPAGYRYGQRQGMRARRFSRIAVAAAKPRIDDLARQRLREFAANFTVN